MQEPSMLLYINYSVQILFLMLGTYYFIISLFAFIPRRKPKDIPGGHNTFALIVAAHNEQAVIKNMVTSLTKLKYPREFYDIFVIADNCTDSTADVARTAGANVFERSNADKRGKGFALEWMFDKLFNMERQYDYVAIFDADNLVDPNFLHEMNKQTQLGHKAVQGYVDSKNPNDSWISYSYSLAFWTVNKLFQQARYNLGLGCQLSGTGFVVQADTLKEMGWGATCLTEDMEFTMKLALNNIKVSWANDAKIYDEKPITFAQSWKQRIRWMQGHADVASRFFAPLMKKTFTEGNIKPFDCAMYLMQPLRIIVMGVITVMAWMQVAYPTTTLIVWGFIPSSIWNVIAVMQFLWGPLVLIVEKKFTLRTVWGFIVYSFYSLTWVPIAIIGIANKNKHEWFHTQHTRVLALDEMNEK